MSILETLAVFVGIPAVVTAIIAGLAFLGSPIAGKHPTHFNLGDNWTHAPVLWSATGEVTTHSHHGSGHAEIEAAPADLIGGRSSGKW